MNFFSTHHASFGCTLAIPNSLILMAANWGLRCCGIGLFLKRYCGENMVGCGELKSYGVRDFIFQAAVLRGKTKMAVLRCCQVLRCAMYSIYSYETNEQSTIVLVCSLHICNQVMK